MHSLFADIVSEVSRVYLADGLYEFDDVVWAVLLVCSYRGLSEDVTDDALDYALDSLCAL